MDTKKVICPVCWHEETWAAIRHHREAVYDDMPNMSWHRPDGGYRGQQVTMWDNGHWCCEACGISLPPHMAAVLIDAVLRVSDPDSDSYDENANTFGDALIAESGGKI